MAHDIFILNIFSSDVEGSSSEERDHGFLILLGMIFGYSINLLFGLSFVNQFYSICFFFGGKRNFCSLVHLLDRFGLFFFNDA